MVTNSDPDQPPVSPEAKLAQLLQSNSYIVYHDQIPDREHPHVKCSIFGALKTNELYVRVENSKRAYVAVAPSPLVFPVMADRIFGLDASDEKVAFGLADQLWDKHKVDLIAQ
jgi:hypothetical protein